MGLVIVSANPSPVTRDQMIDHLRLAGLDAQNDLLDSIIAGSTGVIQGATGLYLSTITATHTRDTFPGDRCLPHWHSERHPILHRDDLAIHLPASPVVSVQSVSYIDANGSTQTLSTSVYKLDATRPIARLCLKSGQSWPATLDEANAVTIAFTAGYADAAHVPAELLSAIKLLAAHWYVNRETVVVGNIVNELPFAVQSIIDLHSVNAA